MQEMPELDFHTVLRMLLYSPDSWIQVVVLITGSFEDQREINTEAGEPVRQPVASVHYPDGIETLFAIFAFEYRD